LVGSNAWTVALAKELHALGTPILIVDQSWQRLARARLEGLPHYHGEILNEATEHNLDLAPFQVLVAATENEAYNALVCNEFAHEIGRDMVYQLGENQTKESRHALPESIRGRALFEDGFGVSEVNDRTRDGWVFKKTTLSNAFGFEDAQAKLSEAASLLLIVRENGTLRFFTHAVRPEPRAGDTVISYAPPKTMEKAKT
jgi:hypothetical protein